MSTFAIKVNKAERVKVLKFIDEKQNVKVTCICGCVVSRVNLPAHRKSYIHKQLVLAAYARCWALPPNTITTPKKRTKTSIEKDAVDFYRERDELRDKTLNIILKEDKDLLKRPTEFNDPKKMKKMKKLSNQLFETYKKSMSDLYDKYNFSKYEYKAKALSDFRFFIRQAKRKGAKD